LIVLLLGLSATPTLARATATSDEVRQATQDVLSGADFQLDLPLEQSEETPESRPEPTPKPRTAPQQSRREPLPPPEIEIELPERPRDFSTVLWVVLAVVGAALLAVFAFNRFRFVGKPMDRETPEAARPQQPAPAMPDEQRDRPRVPGILDKADRLASRGNHSEAVHTLLLITLDILRRRLGRKIAASLTSREILSAVPLAHEATSALSLIVAMAEHGHFGGKVLSAADYRKCKESFRLLVVESNGPSR
jgi:hypothetical protein